MSRLGLGIVINEEQGLGVAGSMPTSCPEYGCDSA